MIYLRGVSVFAIKFKQRCTAWNFEVIWNFKIPYKTALFEFYGKDWLTLHLLDYCSTYEKQIVKRKIKSNKIQIHFEMWRHFHTPQFVECLHWKNALPLKPVKPKKLIFLR